MIGALLLARAHRATRIAAAAIYAASVSALFGASALYHRGNWTASCLIVMWILTLTATAVHMAWIGAPEVVVGGTFVGLC